jgi:hypothetical protein
MVSAATILRWSRTINQRVAAIAAAEMMIVAATETAIMAAAPMVAPTVAEAAVDAAVK